MHLITKAQQLLRQKSVRIMLIALLVVLVLVVVSKKNGPTEAPVELKLPVVELTTPTEYAGGQSLSVIGTVRAFSEARITAERSGRVVSVPVSLGQQVAAGTVLATLENAAERAAVLQAEGVHDAAVAAAAQSNVGVDEAATAVLNAENNAVATFKSAYNTTNGIVRNPIDDFFGDPDSNVPGLRIDGRGFTATLNAERVAYQTLLPTWQSKANTISNGSDLETELQYSLELVQRTIDFVDLFLTVFATQEDNGRYSDAELQAFTSEFTTARATLIGLQTSINGALAGLDSAADVERRAALAASGGESSAADAQVKQALGALRAAQANLNKTIFRTPVSGTVNSLSVRTGDFVGAFDPVAVVANNDALEIVTYVSDTEKDMINVGEIVLIEDVFEGRVVEIAPAVDSATRKTEVRIATEGADIANGDTVRIAKQFAGEAQQTTDVRVPLTAVKFEREDGFVFVVVDGKLVQKPVMLGDILGGSVAVTAGLSAAEAFVVDARGLIDGEVVTVAE